MLWEVPITKEVSVSDLKSCSNDIERVLLFEKMYFKITNFSVDIVLSLLNQFEDPKIRNKVYYQSIEHFLCDMSTDEIDKLGLDIGITEKINWPPRI